MNPSAALSFCERGMDIWDATELMRLGWLRRATDNFRWCAVVAATLGIRVPTHIGETPSESKDEHQEDEKRDDDMEGAQEPPGEEQPQSHLERQENCAAAGNVKKQRVLKPSGIGEGAGGGSEPAGAFKESATTQRAGMTQIMNMIEGMEKEGFESDILNMQGSQCGARKNLGSSR